LALAAQTLKNNGASKVYALVSHGVLSGNGPQKIEESVLEELVITNSIPLTEAAKKVKKIKVIDIAPMLSEAIRRTHNGESISLLFK
jgi:ribose-phosphate pyrophosphokinase